MSDLKRIVLGLAPLEEEAIEDTLYGSAGLRVLASGADAGELLELATAVHPDLVLVSPQLPGLDRRSLARLRALGPRLAGLALDEHAAALLEALDLDLVVRPPLEAATLVELLDGQRGAEPIRSEPAGVELDPARARVGSVVAFLGGKGSPGASELALSFSAHLARDHGVLLAELDFDGCGLASQLGVDSREGSLLGLVRALAAGERDVPTLLPHWIVAGVRGWPAVLPGLPDPPADVAEASTPGLATRALELLAASYPLVVCDVGHRLRGGGGDLAVRLHREVALAADAVIVVIGARPAQLDAGLAQVELLLADLRLDPAALRVVVNGQPGARSPRPGGIPELVARLAERGVTVDGWLPYDERALRGAQRQGVPLGLGARRSRYARAVAALADAILLPSLPRPAARKRRLLPTASVASGPAGAAEEVPLPWRQ